MKRDFASAALTYQTIAMRGTDITVVILPRATAVPSDHVEISPSQRDRHIASIEKNGRLGWQEETSYGSRSLVNIAMGRYKAIIGPRLRARRVGNQRNVAAIGVAILNCMRVGDEPCISRAIYRNTLNFDHAVSIAHGRT